MRVNCEHSKSASVISGVPQVSILGPLLFLIFINDLPDHVNFLVYLFADDTKLSHQVSSAEDARQLQHDIYMLCQLGPHNGCLSLTKINATF